MARVGKVELRNLIESLINKMQRGDSAIRKWILSKIQNQNGCVQNGDIPISQFMAILLGKMTTNHEISVPDFRKKVPHGDKDPMKKDGARNLRSGDVEIILPSGYD
jgi:hypothetical protein